MTTVTYGRPAGHIRTMQLALLRQLAAALAVLAVVTAVVHLGPGGRWWALPAVGAAIAWVWVKGSVRPALARLGAGARAERRVGRALERIGATAVLHGLDVEGRGGDADHVVIGPCLAVVETKSGRGQVTVAADGTVTAGGRRLPRRPLEQARRQADKVARATGRGCDAVVCIADGSFRPFQRHGVWLCAPRDLGPVLGAFPTRAQPGADATELAAGLWRDRADQPA